MNWWPFGKKPRTERVVKPVIRARYDSAQTSVNNSRHWAWSDNLSANAANSLSVRKILRERSRYEVANNAYARGIINTLAEDVVGIGPNIQMGGTDRSDRDNQILEKRFAEWMKVTKLAKKLRVMRKAKCQDGEAFAIMARNDNLDSPVQLDIKLIECDRVTNNDLTTNTETNNIDGIQFDEFGNPVEYNVLDRHPGNNGGFNTEATKIPADNMIHWFKPDRPEQARGIPEINASLTLFADLRRYTLAVVDAAESAASQSGIIKSSLNADDAALAEEFDTIEFERNMWTTLPDGYDIGQMKAEQPVNTYKEFKKELIGEIARPLSMPFNIAAADSSDYNFASGRLDHQTYFRAIEIDRSDLAIEALDVIFDRWFDEAVLIEEYLPQSFRTIDVDTTHAWIFNNRETGDPKKMADADNIRLQNGSDTLANIYARKGQDWRVQVEQRERELEILPMDTNNVGVEEESEVSPNEA